MTGHVYSRAFACALLVIAASACGVTAKSAAPHGSCGDGTRNPGEECDPGVDEFCDPDCTIPGSSIFDPSNPLNAHLVASGPIEPNVPADEEGSFRLKCGVSHVNYDDPIVYPGQPGMAHLHMFFGNVDIDADITTENIAASSGSTCQGGPVNLSGYWAPSMVRPAGAGYAIVWPEDTYVLDENGVPLEDADKNPILNGNQGPDIYYKRAAAQGDMIPYPTGLRMIVGTAGATPDNLDPNGPLWACHEEGGAWSPTIPRCVPNPDPAGPVWHLHLVLDFPQCWDGVNLDSANHKSHMAFPDYSSGTPACPPTHPHWMPAVSYNIYYPVTAANVGPEGDTRHWFMASDSYEITDTSPGGASAHGDWFMAWNPEVMAAFVQWCLNERRHCANGELGNGWSLTGVMPGRGNSEGYEILNHGLGH